MLFFFYRSKEKLKKLPKRQNKKLDDLKRELPAANDNKAKLFGLISHDLRSPTSKLVQLLQLQEENSSNLKHDLRTRYHEHVNKVSRNVLETMEEILLWRKSQMSHFAPEYRTVKIRNVIEQKLRLMEELVRDKNLRIAVNVNRDMEMVPMKILLR